MVGLGDGLIVSVMIVKLGVVLGTVMEAGFASFGRSEEQRM
jgi:hypothetical protein